MKTFVGFLALLVKMVPLLMLWFAKQAGKRERDAEQNAVNAKARMKYEEIEMREDDGKWIK